MKGKDVVTCGTYIFSKILKVVQLKRRVVKVVN